jgi:hypothetical protein
MEVHHHSHPSTSSGTRKKWTHYFWEFFMLFLAVFCGFLAEYQLEHKIEMDRAKQYVASFIEDLEADSTMLHEAINVQLPWGISDADSLIKLLNAKDPRPFAAEIYFLSEQVRRRFFHTFQDRTIVQLRNAGGLRLITNQKVKNSINLYYERVDILKYFDDQIEGNFKEMKMLWPKVFSTAELQKIYDPENDNLVRPKEIFRLRSTDPDVMNQLAFYFYRYRSQESQYRKRARTLYLQIPKLIALIKKEYNLK